MLLFDISPLFFSKLRYFEPRFWAKIDGRTIDLKPLPEWRWSITIDEPEMRLAVGAQTPLHRLLIFKIRVLESIAVARAAEDIFLELHRVHDMVPKSGVPALRLILVVAHKQPLGAALAGIHAYILRPPQVAGEGPLVAHALSHEILQWRKLLLDGVLALVQVLCTPGIEGLDRGPGAMLAQLKAGL